MFKYEGAFITNIKNNKAMDVSGNRDRENQNIIVHGKHGGLNQQWDIVYVDEWKGEPKKGEMNEEFGFIVDEDFYIISDMPQHRYLQALNDRNLVVKTKNGLRE